MARLEHVTVEGFKGVEGIAFDPGMVNVVTGRNNSGKTSLLEAVDLACEPLHIEQFEKPDSLRNYSCPDCRITARTDNRAWTVEITEPSEQSAREWMFREFREQIGRVEQKATDESDLNETEAQHAVEAVLVEFLKRFDPRDNTLVLTVNDEKYPVVYYTESLRERLTEAVGEVLDKLVGERPAEDTKFGTKQAVYSLSVDPPKMSFVEEVPPIMLGSSIIDVSAPNPPEVTEEEHAVRREELEEFIRDRGLIENLKSLDFDFLVFAEDGEKHSVPYEFMGDGFNSMVNILWRLLADDLPDVVLLEEPDIHMHPGYVRQLVYFLIELAREEKIQLFVTTHNSDFLNDLFAENLTDEERAFLDEEFRLIQMQDGYASIKNYEEAEESLKELHIDLRGI